MKEKMGLERCESPLETVLAHAWASVGEFEWRSPDRHPWEIGRWPGLWLALLAQPNYDKYRCDFGLSSCFPKDMESPPFIVVVEVDGHEFHERTKEQAERDRRRDRFMTATEAKVFRFTGREVNRDAAACAREVVEYVFPLQERNIDQHWKEWVLDAARTGTYPRKKPDANQE